MFGRIKSAVYFVSAICSIAGFLYIFYPFSNQKKDIPNVLHVPEKIDTDNITKYYEQNKESQDYSVKDYEKNKEFYETMIDVARSIPYSSDRSIEFEKLVLFFLDDGNFYYALESVKHISYSSSRNDMLMKIVDRAVQKRATIKYAKQAAEKMPYSSSRSEALAKILKASREIE